MARCSPSLSAFLLRQFALLETFQRLRELVLVQGSARAMLLSPVEWLSLFFPGEKRGELVCGEIQARAPSKGAVARSISRFACLRMTLLVGARFAMVRATRFCRKDRRDFRC